VASVRFWYPDIPIWLLKDRQYGDVQYREIEMYWNVRVYPSRQKTQAGFWQARGYNPIARAPAPPPDSDIVFQDG